MAPLATAALVIVAGAACAGGGWVETAPDVATRARTDPGSFVAATADRYAGQEFLAVSYRIEVSRGVAGTSADVFVLVRRPDLVYVDLLLPDGSTGARLVAGTDEVALWDRDAATLWTGDRTEGAFGRALGLDMRAADTVGVLTGHGIPASEVTGSRWDEEEQRIVVSGPGGAEAWLHPLRRLHERFRFGSGPGRVEVRVVEWLEREPPVPRRLDVRVPSEDLRVELTVSRLQDLAYQPGMFDVERPAGARVLPLAELEEGGGLLPRSLR